jgi:hypothetical protein
MIEAPATVSRAAEWMHRGRKFYDDDDFLKKASKGIRLRKPVVYEDCVKWKKRKVRKGDIVVDLWGKVGVVTAVFEEKNPDFGYCDFVALCKQDYAPFLAEKRYWNGMVKTVLGAR